ncbi:UDP-glucose 4-epimerase GalE [Actinocatenispora rupis]|uniref:UDP-glucose 4-epimerase n=1 Tax=Actinocatenispora rupis TaxID=519421 RepID=A0A8J3NCB7_9ACTN|nr:UDP-glucose 4-epimerase GalE [Actinocatenispora rupis]GID11720.1 UDP-glucose 4-epimerase GalE [Actinocatenispora rupis]
MKLLVTGGAGYIGSIVTRQLLAAGHQVEILDDLSTGHRDNVPAEVPFHELSIHDVAQVLTPGAGFDGVLHFGAKIAAGESVVKPELYWDVNIRGSLALLEAIRAAGVRRLVFSSTAAVYGDGPGTDELITETTPPAPTNPYGSSKLAVDMMITAATGASDLGAVSLRYFNAAGASVPAEGSSAAFLGERHDPETHLIPIALQAAAGDRAEFLLYGDDYDTPDGTCIRDYIHVEDLATAHLLALDSAEAGTHKIYNLGNGNGYSNKQVVEVVREVTGAKLPVTLAPRRDGDAVVVVASAEKARRELGWAPAKPDLAAIIADAWAFYQYDKGRS